MDTLWGKGERNNMNHNQKRDKETYSELSNVDTAHDSLIPEEFPEGPVGSPFRKHKKVEGKSTEWEEGQQRTSAYTYPDKDQHDDLPRRASGSHPLHDE